MQDLPGLIGAVASATDETTKNEGKRALVARLSDLLCIAADDILATIAAY